jgi:hypothetical protein
MDFQYTLQRRLQQRGDHLREELTPSEDEEEEIPLQSSYDHNFRIKRRIRTDQPMYVSSGDWRQAPREHPRPSGL